MRIDHVALWAVDIDSLCAFYQEYFDARSSARYVNERTGFESVFLEFEGGSRLELMQRPDVRPVHRESADQEFIGYAHIAMSLGSTEAVDEVTRKIVSAGYRLLSGPRTTGDGYYESVVVDPEGNRVELTV